MYFRFGGIIILMKNDINKLKKIEEVYDKAIEKLQNLRKEQAKIIANTIKTLEKDKIKELQEQLKK